MAVINEENHLSVEIELNPAITDRVLNNVRDEDTEPFLTMLDEFGAVVLTSARTYMDDSHIGESMKQIFARVAEHSANRLEIILPDDRNLATLMRRLRLLNEQGYVRNVLIPTDGPLVNMNRNQKVEPPAYPPKTQICKWMDRPYAK